MHQPVRKVLVVDDEPRIREVVAALFEGRGFAVTAAENGRQALALWETERFALVVLDLMLPDLPGEDVCRAIRRQSRVPILMLTAKAEETDLLRGLSIGADDYIVKPFSLKELAARAEAVLRRSAEDLTPLSQCCSYRNGDLTVDFEKNTVKKRGAAVPLTPSEWRLLAALMKYPGRVLSRGELIDLALGREFEGFDRAVDSHIKNLRQKIEDDPRSPAYVLTVHGLGYRFGGE